MDGRVEETYQAVAEVEELNNNLQRKLASAKEARNTEECFGHLLEFQLTQVTNENAKIEQEICSLELELQRLHVYSKKLDLLLSHLRNYNLVGDVRLDIKAQTMGYVQDRGLDFVDQIPADDDNINWSPIN